MIRCGWVSQDPLYMEYHDKEWGVPVTDGQHLFEMICLEGQQAGLSWITVLKKRDSYRQHFFQFSIETIASFTDEQLQLKCEDASLIRHIGKLKAIRDNAIAWQYLTQELKPQQSNVSEWLWNFVAQKTRYNDVPDYRQAPAQTEISIALSKALK